MSDYVVTAITIPKKIKIKAKRIIIKHEVSLSGLIAFLLDNETIVENAAKCIKHAK